MKTSRSTYRQFFFPDLENTEFYKILFLLLKDLRLATPGNNGLNRLNVPPQQGSLHVAFNKDKET